MKRKYETTETGSTKRPKQELSLLHRILFQKDVEFVFSKALGGDVWNLFDVLPHHDLRSCLSHIYVTSHTKERASKVLNQEWPQLQSIHMYQVHNYTLSWPASPLPTLKRTAEFKHCTDVQLLCEHNVHTLALIGCTRTSLVTNQEDEIRSFQYEVFKDTDDEPLYSLLTLYSKVTTLEINFVQIEKARTIVVPSSCKHLKLSASAWLSKPKQLTLEGTDVELETLTLDGVSANIRAFDTSNVTHLVLDSVQTLTGLCPKLAHLRSLSCDLSDLSRLPATFPELQRVCLSMPLKKKEEEVACTLQAPQLTHLEVCCHSTVCKTFRFQAPKQALEHVSFCLSSSIKTVYLQNVQATAAVVTFLQQPNSSSLEALLDSKHQHCVHVDTEISSFRVESTYLVLLDIQGVVQDQYIQEWKDRVWQAIEVLKQDKIRTVFAHLVQPNHWETFRDEQMTAFNHRWTNAKKEYQQLVERYRSLLNELFALHKQTPNVKTGSHLFLELEQLYRIGNGVTTKSLDEAYSTSLKCHLQTMERMETILNEATTTRFTQEYKKFESQVKFIFKRSQINQAEERAAREQFERSICELEKAKSAPLFRKRALRVLEYGMYLHRTVKGCTEYHLKKICKYLQETIPLETNTLLDLQTLKINAYRLFHRMQLCKRLLEEPQTSLVDVDLERLSTL